MIKFIRFIFIFITVICICSCNGNQNQNQRQMPEIKKTSQEGTYLTEITIDNNTCEYVVLYRCGQIIGMSHWTHCKYCNKHTINVMTNDCGELIISYSGKEVSGDVMNDIREYIHNYSTNEIKTDYFKEHFNSRYHLKNCNFNYNIN